MTDRIAQALDLKAIEDRLARRYVFDRPGEVVVAPEDDIRDLSAEVQRLRGEQEADFETSLKHYSPLVALVREWQEARKELVNVAHDLEKRVGYKGPMVERIVTYISHPSEFTPLAEGYVILSLGRPS